MSHSTSPTSELPAQWDQTSIRHCIGPSVTLSLGFVKSLDYRAHVSFSSALIPGARKFCHRILSDGRWCSVLSLPHDTMAYSWPGVLFPYRSPRRSLLNSSHYLPASWLASEATPKLGDPRQIHPSSTRWRDEELLFFVYISVIDISIGTTSRLRTYISLMLDEPIWVFCLSVRSTSSPHLPQFPMSPLLWPLPALLSILSAAACSDARVFLCSSHLTFRLPIPLSRFSPSNSQGENRALLHSRGIWIHLRDCRLDSGSQGLDHLCAHMNIQCHKQLSCGPKNLHLETGSIFLRGNAGLHSTPHSVEFFVSKF